MFTFREVTVDDAKLLLDWRTSKRVAQFLNTDVSYDLDAQKKWIEGCGKKEHYYHWIIQLNGKDIGHLNFTDWNRDQRRLSWGLYIGEDDALGAGGIVPLYFYNFCFDELNVEAIPAEVFYTNVSAIKLFLVHHYKFFPSRNFVISKNGKKILMVCMELSKNDFKNSRFQKFRSKFPINNWKYKHLIRSE